MPADVQDALRPSPRRAARSEPASAPAWENPKKSARARRAALARPPAATEWTQPRPSAPAAEEPGDVVEEFARAMAEYRQRSGRMFPTWCEVLEVLQSLGYRRVASAGSGEDPGAVEGRSASE
jgi:hypothetical protein